MRALAGVAAETVALACILAASPSVPPGLPFAVYLVLAQLAATYLVHCPAHYLIGTLGGIKFLKIGPGRSTLATALPARLARFAGVVPILTLFTDRATLSRASKRKAAYMYASGTVAWASAAFVIAGVASISHPLPSVLPAWALATCYLLFDVVFSPRSGDLMKAREVLGS